MAVIAIVIAMSAGGGGNGKTVQVVIPPDTPEPTHIPEPTVNIDATVQAGIQRGLAERPTSVPVPTATYTPIPPTKTPTPTRIPTRRPTYTPTPKVPPTPTATSWFNKGEVYRKSENWKTAILRYSETIRLNRSHTNAYFYRAYSHAKLGQHSNAVQDYSKVIDLNPSAGAYNNRAISYRQLGKYANANADDAKACSLDSKYCVPPTPTPKPPTPTPELAGASPTGIIPRLGATVESLKLFESGSGSTARDSRIYRYYFDGSTTRYINWELSLEWEATSQTKREWTTTWVLYRKGNDIPETTQTDVTSAEGGWISSEHLRGWGRSTTGSWTPGFYYFNFFVDGDLIAQAEFEVY
jgi:hypothetical protein